MFHQDGRGGEFWALELLSELLAGESALDLHGGLVEGDRAGSCSCFGGRESKGRVESGQ